MPTRIRSLLLAIGVFLAAATVWVLHRQSQRAAAEDGPGPVLTLVEDIKAGSYRFIPDLYGKAPNSDSRSLLFMRKADGSLRAWYVPIRERSPAAPDEDWLTPGQACEPFVVDAEREDIECTITDVEQNQSIHLRWSWDGESFGPFAPDMKPVPGKEENGKFLFDIDSTDPAKDRR